MKNMTSAPPSTQRTSAVVDRAHKRPAWGAYFASAPVAALFLGVSSGFPSSMLTATLTTRLAEARIDKRSISAFALALLVYSFKWAWAPLVDRVHFPILSRRFGQRRAWLWLSAVSVMVAVTLLGLADPALDIRAVAMAAVFLGFCGATFDIVIDAYRIELLDPEQLGAGSGMSQYGWRIGGAVAGAIALTGAARSSWTLGYVLCTPPALCALLASLVMGEPQRHREAVQPRG